MAKVQVVPSNTKNKKQVSGHGAITQKKVVAKKDKVVDKLQVAQAKKVPAKAKSGAKADKRISLNKKIESKVKSKNSDDILNRKKLESKASDVGNVAKSNKHKKISTGTVSSKADRPIKVPEIKKIKGRIVQASKDAVAPRFGKDLTARHSPEKKTQAYQQKRAQDNKEVAQHLLTPTNEMLKPFREAAVRNQELQKKKLKEGKKKGFLAKPLKTGKKVNIDLRVHSPMSEGYFSTGGVDPAGAMVRLAKAKGLDMIAVTDYNSAEFIDIVKEKAQNTPVTIIPGVDLRCRIGKCDEVYLVALFPENRSSEDIYKVLSDLGVPLVARGRKKYVVEKEIREVVSVVEGAGGVVIPSRPDKTPSRLNAVKTLVEELGFRTFDLVHPENPEYFKERWPQGEFTFISFSNANALGQIGSRGLSLRIPANGFAGIKAVCERRKAE